MKKAAPKGKNMMCYVGVKGNDDVFIAKAVQNSARVAEASLTSLLQQLPLVCLLLLGCAHPKP